MFRASFAGPADDAVNSIALPQNVASVNLRHPAPLKIYINGLIDDRVAYQVRRQLEQVHAAQQPIVVISIHSQGGEVDAAFMILNHIERLKQEGTVVVTFVSQKAQSCAAFLFGAGTPGHRYVGVHGTLLIHECSTGGGGYDQKLHDVAAKFSRMESMNEHVLSTINAQCGQASGHIENLLLKNHNADLTYTGADAVGLGIADHVTKSVPEVKVAIGPLTYSFGNMNMHSKVGAEPDVWCRDDTPGPTDTDTMHEVALRGPHSRRHVFCP